MKGESSRLRKDPKRRAKINAGWRDYYQRRMAKLAADPVAMRAYLDRKGRANKRSDERNPTRRTKYEARRKRRLRRDPAYRSAQRAMHRASYYRSSLDKMAGRAGRKPRPTKCALLMLDIQRLIPRSVDPSVRADLAQDLIAAIIAGETTIERLQGDPRAMRKYTARASKLLAETWNQVSLDDCIPGTDLTYKEALPDDVMHF